MKTVRKNKGPDHLSRFVKTVIALLTLALISASPVAAANGKGEDLSSKRGVLQQKLSESERTVNVTLIGVTQYEVTEIFHHLLLNTDGVVQARRYRLRLEPHNPAACIVVWQVKLEDTDAFHLESDLYRLVRDVTGTEDAIFKSDLLFQPTAEDLALLKEIRPWRASSREIEFVLDRPIRSGLKERRCMEFRVGDCRSWPDSGFE